MLVVALVALTTWVVNVRSSAKATDSGPTTLAQSVFLQSTGIRVIRVAETGGGGLVDFRYQVIDPDKAELIHLQRPRLVDERTGTLVDTLFMGHSHHGVPKAGYSYPLLFVNSQGLIKRGGTVAVVIGDARLDHVPVL